MKRNSSYLLLSLLYACLFYSCICNESYVFRVPVKITSPQSEYRLGDTLLFQMLMDRKSVYDTSNREYFHIPEFNPYLKVHNVVIDEYPTKDDLDTSNFLNNNNKFEYVYYSARSSYGIRIDTPYVNKDSILVYCGIILNKPGLHMIYFESPIGIIRGGFEFSGKCNNSISDAFVQLQNENNENILTQDNQNVVNQHFANSPGVNQRSAKFYYRVSE